MATLQAEAHTSVKNESCLNVMCTRRNPPDIIRGGLIFWKIYRARKALRFHGWFLARVSHWQRTESFVIMRLIYSLREKKLRSKVFRMTHVATWLKLGSFTQFVFFLVLCLTVNNSNLANNKWTLKRSGDIEKYLHLQSKRARNYWYSLFLS